MGISPDQAAQVLGMKTTEVRDIVDVDGGSVVTTHDGQRHAINHQGEVVALAGVPAQTPEPVIHHAGAAPQIVPGELVPGTTTTATAGPGEELQLPECVLGEVAGGVTLEAIATVVANEFNLPAAAVLDVLDAEFGDPVPDVVSDDVVDDDEGQGAELVEVEQGQGDELVELDDGLVDDDVVEPLGPVEPVDVDAVPAGNADVVLAWVGDDRDRARRALELEEAKTAGRRGTLVTKLQRIVGAE